MGWKAAINFRQTSGYVADRISETYCLADTWPVFRNGLTFGWTTLASTDARDRSTTTDVRLAGINFTFNGGRSNFRLRMDGGAGLYLFKIAVHDAFASQANVFVSVMDGGQTKFIVDTSTSLVDTEVIVATGTRVAPATFTVTSGAPVVQYFGSPYLNITMGHRTATAASVLAHLYVERIDNMPVFMPKFIGLTGPGSGSDLGAVQFSESSTNLILVTVPEETA